MAAKAERQAEPATAAARTTIAVQGARVHNLKNISVEIPRDQLIVVTGLSGSGKSSLAFDTIYAEGQRRYMESLSSYAKRFVAQVAKPDVDFVFGLSPVISIEQKTIASNPRSTVGTMTDIASYLNLLFATIGEPHCPRTGEPTPSRTASQILEAILSLPEGTEIELRAPVFKVYGEELDFVFTEVRKKGCRRLIVDGKPVDISEQVELDESTVQRHGRGRRSLRRRPQAREGDQGRRSPRRCSSATGCCRSTSSRARRKAEAERFYQGAVQRRRTTSSTATSGPSTSCSTIPRAPAGPAAASASTSSRIPELLVPDPKRSIRGGCFVREAFKYNPDTWDGRMMYSLSKALRFSLDTPWEQLPETARNAILYGIEPRRSRCTSPPDAKVKRDEQEGKEVGFGGIARRIERHYRRYRQRGEANSDGSVARQGDGRAHLPRLQRRAAARDAAAVHHRRQDASTTSASSTSTSCTRSSAPSSRPAAAPTPAGRC